MFETNKIVKALEIICSLTLIGTCVFTNLQSSYCTCVMESCRDLLSTHINSAFPRIVAIVCMISKLKMIFHSANDGFYKYEDKIKGYEVHFPNSTLETNAYRMFALFIVSTYAAVVLPINVLRIHNIYYEVQENTVIVFYILMYLQNWSICSIEIHFIIHCFGLYQKFCQINEEMSMLKSETIITNNYPSVLQCAEQRNCDSIKIPFKLDVECTVIELIRMKHQFVREVKNDLNLLYGVQLALSICVLCVMIIIDTYTEIFALKSRARSKLLFYGWLLQYFFRFFSIVMVTHHTTEQAYKTKKLISDVNNRYLDINIKEELELFFNQIFRRAVEYTTCDIFTLNAPLITSAIAAGTTYCIVLLQLQRKMLMDDGNV